MERHIPYLLFKMVFLAFKTLLSPYGAREKNFSVNFERYNLANGGGHVDIEVSYKTLWLNVLKETLILYNLSCFE
jgi:hypothetical protein